MEYSSTNSFVLPKFNNLISFEGIDGCGKTTQIKALQSFLESNGYNVLCLREPGGTEFGEKLREAILEAKQKLPAISEAYLFASSRAQLLNELVIPFISKSSKNICILDRFIHSSIAYQGFARNLGANTVLNIHQHEPLNVIPNITFYLKISIDTSFSRQASRNQEKDYFEKEKRSFFLSLIKGYESCTNYLPSKFFTIDGEKEPDTIHKKIIDQLNLDTL